MAESFKHCIRIVITVHLITLKIFPKNNSTSVLKWLVSIYGKVQQWIANCLNKTGQNDDR